LKISRTEESFITVFGLKAAARKIVIFPFTVYKLTLLVVLNEIRNGDISQCRLHKLGFVIIANLYHVLGTEAHCLTETPGNKALNFSTPANWDFREFGYNIPDEMVA